MAKKGNKKTDVIPEPPHMCTDLGAIQSRLARYLINRGLKKGKLYDLIMESCADMDVVKIKIAELRKWGKQFEK